MGVIDEPHLTRRKMLQAGTALGLAGLLTPWVTGKARADGLTLTLADVGVGDPGGDWSKFQEMSGDSVNLVSISNAPSAVLNQLIAGVLPRGA